MIVTLYLRISELETIARKVNGDSVCHSVWNVYVCFSPFTVKFRSVFHPEIKISCTSGKMTRLISIQWGKTEQNFYSAIITVDPIFPRQNRRWWCVRVSDRVITWLSVATFLPSAAPHYVGGNDSDVMTRYLCYPL